MKFPKNATFKNVRNSLIKLEKSAKSEVIVLKQMFKAKILTEKRGVKPIIIKKIKNGIRRVKLTRSHGSS